MKIKVGVVRCRADARQVCEQVFVHVCGVRLGREDLVVHGGVERDGLVDDVDDLGLTSVRLGRDSSERKGHTLAWISGSTLNDVKHARRSAGAAHFCPAIAAQGSVALSPSDWALQESVAAATARYAANVLAMGR